MKFVLETMSNNTEKQDPSSIPEISIENRDDQTEKRPLSSATNEISEVYSLQIFQRNPWNIFRR